MAEPGADRTYIPAAGHDWLLPFYDPLWKLMGGDSTRRATIERAALEPGQRVLDIGCGTGSLAILIRRLHPEVEVVGLDPDPKALARAARKARAAGVSLQLDRGFSDELPYPEARFDRVFSSFMFHHLDAEVKRKTLLETRRVLAPGGVLHLVDFGGSGHSHGALARLLHSREHLRDHFDGGLPALMAEAGYAEPTELEQRATLFGRMVHYRASVPAR